MTRLMTVLVAIFAMASVALAAQITLPASGAANAGVTAKLAAEVCAPLRDLDSPSAKFRPCERRVNGQAVTCQADPLIGTTEVTCSPVPRALPVAERLLHPVAVTLAERLFRPPRAA